MDRLKQTLLIWLSFTLVNSLLAQNGTHELSIKVFNQTAEIALENTQIAIDPCNCGGVTDENGFFTINLPEGIYTLNVSFIGFIEQELVLVLNKAERLEILLEEKTEELSEVIVRAKKVSENIDSPQMGVLRLDPKALKKLPSALGEFDVLRSVTLLPGVNNAGDVSNGLSVRGGSLDQNLLLYDYAPIFNPTHLFGLFSVFTPDVIASVDMFRANIPSRYGGRVASVLDVKVKKPYVDKFNLNGGIGLSSSRLRIETPVIKDKLMVLAGGRIGFTDFLLPLFSNELKNTKARFSDATLKLLYLPTEKDQLTFTGFYSKDFYQIDLISKVQNINAENNQYDFSTLNGTINWLHSFDDGSFLKIILVGSNYTPKIIFPEIESNNKLTYSSKIVSANLTTEFSKKVNNKFDYYVGTHVNRFAIEPGNLNPGNITSVREVSLETETSYELSTYFNTNWSPTDFLTLSTGLRYNYFMFLGPYNLATYDEAGKELLSTQVFEKGEEVAAYDALEPRAGLSLKLGENTSIKASYARINQYLQNVYNSTSPLPTSRWKVANPHILPQISDTYGLGWYKNILGGDIELSLEGYYRNSHNVLTYRPGAEFFLEEFLEKDVVQVEGKAYGVEFNFSKPRGKINGWLNYAWSRSLLQSTEANVANKINNNQWFKSDFDRPHVFNATVNFEGHKYNTVSFNFTMQSGRPYSRANLYVKIDEVNVPIFLERNNVRLPLYHRLDLSWNVHFSKSKENKRWQNDWTFTVYNLYGRDNPLNIFYTKNHTRSNGLRLFGGGPLGASRISILNNPLISLTYNFKFQ